MKRKLFLFLLLICLGCCSVACADTLSGDGFHIEYTAPDLWLSSAQYSVEELEDKLGIPEGALKLVSEPPNTTKLYYPVDGAYSLDNAIQITVSPMESYHQNYSSFNETQLDNIAASFMRDDKMDAHQVVHTAGGLTFLQLHHTGGLYEHTFTTNENGAILHADVPASADTAQVRQWLDSISIRVQRNLLLELFIDYWYYFFVSIIIVAGVFLRSKKASSAG